MSSSAMPCPIWRWCCGKTLCPSYFCVGSLADVQILAIGIPAYPTEGCDSPPAGSLLPDPDCPGGVCGPFCGGRGALLKRKKADPRGGAGCQKMPLLGGYPHQGPISLGKIGKRLSFWFFFVSKLGKLYVHAKIRTHVRFREATVPLLWGALAKKAEKPRRLGVFSGWGTV